jgi:hypothetical protein
LEELLQDLYSEISTVPGLSALVLGGSRARGTHTEKSDVDLGLYYHPDRPLDLIALERVAAKYDDTHRPNLITQPGGWGPWINGGGWLTVNGLAVDFIYRDLAKVQGMLEDCLRGKIDTHYQPGHPFGFVSSIYVGELALCKILWEAPPCEVSTLKTQTTPYPPALKQAVIDAYAWEINFSLGVGRKSLLRKDVVYASGCCFRAAMCMLQVLFAINETYWLNEKGALLIAGAFPVRPEALQTRMEAAFNLLTTSAIDQALDALDALATEVQAILPII